MSRGSRLLGRPSALEVAERACEPSIAGFDPMAAAAARYEQGEVRRVRGDPRARRRAADDEDVLDGEEGQAEFETDRATSLYVVIGSVRGDEEYGSWAVAG